jgi:hypothetical protein
MNRAAYQVHAVFSVEFSRSYSEDRELMDLFHASAPVIIEQRYKR